MTRGGIVDIQVDEAQLRDVEQLLRDVPRGTEKAVVGATNDTAKKVKTRMSKAIRDRVFIKKKDIDKHLRVRRATSGHPSATIVLSKSKRLGLQRFGARQIKKGVTYRISRTEGRSRIEGAFIVKSRGGHVFKRKGASRLPIGIRRGPSAWGVFLVADLGKQIEADAAQLLHDAVDRRVKFLLLKKAGKV
ncbi:MAG: hypothetical protein GY842_13880 [bacterium]|nr:hypothetical protein [bacterium]